MKKLNFRAENVRYTSLRQVSLPPFDASIQNLCAHGTNEVTLHAAVPCVSIYDVIHGLGIETERGRDTVHHSHIIGSATIHDLVDKNSCIQST